MQKTKKKRLNWLKERLAERIDRDHFLCIYCFKRMSRGYAATHCSEEHKGLTDEIKALIVKGYLNGKRYVEEMDPKINDETLKSTTTDVQQVKTKDDQKKQKKRTTSSKIPEILKEKLEKLERLREPRWQAKPKREIELERMRVGKKLTTDISTIMADNNIPFNKSDAIWKIITLVLDSTLDLGTQVTDKVRISSRTLKRRHDEQYSSTPAVPVQSIVIPSQPTIHHFPVDETLVPSLGLPHSGLVTHPSDLSPH